MDSVSELADALAKAQGEIKAPLKTREVDFVDKNGRRVNYSYADLADVIEAIKVPLSKNGLSVTHQLAHGEGGAFGMRTSLMHVSGEVISTWYPLPDPAQVKPQEFGSELTYARRYSLSCLVGIASEEDDDGDIAAPTPRQDAKAQAPRPAGALSPAQIARLFAIGKSNQWTPDLIKDVMQKEFGIDSTSKLTRDQYDKLCHFLQSTPFVPSPPQESWDSEDSGL